MAASLLRKPSRAAELRLGRRIDALELSEARLSRRLDELERRVAEGGRRALFPSEQHEHENGPRMAPTSHAELAAVGRALLFDDETP